MDVLKVAEYEIVKDRMYMSTHEWVKEMEDGSWLVGISDYAQKMLREISYVQFEEVGENFETKDILCVVEALKATGDIYAPFDCTLTENNDLLEDNPELIGESPYEKGYLVKIQAKSSDRSALISPEDYVKVVQTELSEL